MPSSDQHKAFHPSTMVDEPVPTPARRRSHRRRKGPKPWFVLKLSVALAVAIIAYAGYVYIGRLCIPMIKREHNSLGSRRLGVIFLAVFSVLGIMAVWAYIKVRTQFSVAPPCRSPSPPSSTPSTPMLSVRTHL
jgi:uncharacterized membrane protein YdbT with pleckstrin-like domain